MFSIQCLIFKGESNGFCVLRKGLKYDIKLANAQVCLCGFNMVVPFKKLNPQAQALTYSLKIKLNN